MITSRLRLLLPVAKMIASSPTCDQATCTRSPRRRPVCEARSTASAISGEQVFFDVSDVGVGPDDFGPIARIQMLDALAGIAGDLAERIDRMGEHAREHLKRVIGGAWLVCPLVAPTANDRPDLLRAFELRHS